MKQIKITRGLYAVVDDLDFDLVNQYKWYAFVHVSKSSTNYYARRDTNKNGVRKSIFLHRYIIGFIPDGMMVDHINGNTLDNRRSNLRLCTSGQNLMNSRKRINCSSKYKGVYWDCNSKKFKAQIQIDGKKTHIGLFKSEEEAARAYNEYAIKYYGEYAKINEQLKIEI